MAIIEATIKAIGIPLKAFGVEADSSLTLIAANKVMTIKKPKEVPIPLARLDKKSRLEAVFSLTTPKTAQLVVIKGKYIPNDLYKDGEYFLINRPTTWTKLAITKI